MKRISRPVNSANIDSCACDPRCCNARWFDARCPDCLEQMAVVELNDNQDTDEQRQANETRAREQIRQELLANPHLCLADLAEDPAYNPQTNAGRQDGSLYDVSGGTVFLQSSKYSSGYKPACIVHGAMNAVNPDRSIWRCLTCSRAAYVSRIVTHTP